MKRSVPLVAALCIALPAPVAAQGLGRLFLTPEQRETLDERRRARVPDKPVATAQVAVSPVTRIDGYVQRQGGKSTVWVNGQAVQEDAREPSARLQPARGELPSVAVRSGDNPTDEVRARAGQSIDTLTGAVRDPLEGGEIRVKRPTPTPPATREGRVR